jgi:hypothetical protein
LVSAREKKRERVVAMACQRELDAEGVREVE